MKTRDSFEQERRKFNREQAMVKKLQERKEAEKSAHEATRIKRRRLALESKVATAQKRLRSLIPKSPALAKYLLDRFELSLYGREQEAWLPDTSREDEQTLAGSLGIKAQSLKVIKAYEQVILFIKWVPGMNKGETVALTILDRELPGRNKRKAGLEAIEVKLMSWSEPSNGFEMHDITYSEDLGIDHVLAAFKNPREIYRLLFHYFGPGQP